MNITMPLALLVLFSCQPSKGELEKHVQSLELSYVAWACDCPNWATSADLARHVDAQLVNKCIYVEPASASLALPDSIGFTNDKVRFTGQFYKYKGFPKGYESEQNPEQARVFRYTAFKIVHSNFTEDERIGIP